MFYGIAGLLYFKAGDAHSNWKKAFVCLHGCFLRISKRQIYDSDNSTILEEDYYCDRFHQVEIMQNLVLEKFSPDIIASGQVRMSPPRPDFYGCIIQVEGMSPNNKTTKVLIAVESDVDCEKWMSAMQSSRHYLTDFIFRNDSRFLVDIAKRMLTSVSIRERVYNLNIYYRCFVGSEAVHWIVNDQHCTLDQAMRIGDTLLRVKVIYHVTHEHMFCNGHYFYRFRTKVLEAYERALGPRADHEDLPPPSNDLPTPSPTPRASNSDEEITDHEANPDMQCLMAQVSSLGRSVETLQRDISALSIELNVMQSRMRGGHLCHSQTSGTAQFRDLVRSVIVPALSVGIVQYLQRGDWSLLDVGVFILMSLVLMGVFVAYGGVDISKHTEGFSTNAAHDLRPKDCSSLPLSHFESRNTTSHDDFISASAPALVSNTVDPSESSTTDGEVDKAASSNDTDSEVIFDGIPRNTAEWPNFPVLARRSPSMCPKGADARHILRPIHLHQPGPLKLSEIALESDLFIGKMILVLSGLNDSPPDIFK